MQERQRLEYLEAMGITVWQPRVPVAPVAGTGKPLARSQPDTAPSGMRDMAAPAMLAEKGSSGISRLKPGVLPAEPPGRQPADDPGCTLEALQQQVAACEQCELHRSRKNTVFGSGNHRADWMIIGEAPGASEDAQGLPFVGKAGQLLTEMIRAVGMTRDDVYIANILKCRPPGNRDPRPEEVAACEGYLIGQIQQVKPRIILAAGRVAAQNLLRSDQPLARLRGEVHHYQNIPVVVVYHPAYLLRNPRDKRKTWDDLRFAMRTYESLRG